MRDASAGEDIYIVEVLSSVVATFTLSNFTVDLDLYLLEYCRSETCLVYGDATLEHTLVPGKPYFLVVDGYMGAEGSYDITMTCGPAPPKLDCSGTTDVCDSIIFDDNLTAPNNVDFYPYCMPWEESGGEKVYHVDIVDGFLRAELDSPGCDLDLFLLPSCDEKTCLYYGDTIIDTGIAYLSPGRYYLVVDGFLGARCSYTLSVTCGTPSPTPTGTWHTPTPSPTPTYTPVPVTPSSTPTLTNTPTLTITPGGPTITPTYTPTNTSSQTPTRTPITLVPIMGNSLSRGLFLLLLSLVFLIPVACRTFR